MCASLLLLMSLALAQFTTAAQLKEARVTQVVKDVKLLRTQTAPRPAAVSDEVRDGTAVRTGVDSRAELTFTDQTLARLGANTIFSFKEATRKVDLASGAMLLYVPKNVGGAKIFAGTIRQIRELTPDCKVEVLIPDFQGIDECLQIVLDAQPDVLNHNTESVPRLYRVVRSGARYERSLRLLENVKKFSPATVSKSGLMAGLGETMDELLAVFRDLAERRVDILTVGQYLRPSKDHLPIARYYTPDEFHFIKVEALKMGFRHVESGPLVRSSYHAHEHVAGAQPAALSTQ